MTVQTREFALELEVRADGLVLEGTVVPYGEEARLGDEVLELVSDRALTGLSVGFLPVPGGDRWNAAPDRVERLRAQAHHVGVVPAVSAAAIPSSTATAAPTASASGGSRDEPGPCLPRVRRAGPRRVALSTAQGQA